jgi:hypothetical protein
LRLLGGLQTGHRGRPGAPELGSGGGGQAHRGHEPLHGLGEFLVAGQRRHLVLPQIQVTPRQLVQVRPLRHRTRLY